MSALVDGLWLQQYVAPGLLQEFRNYNDAFISVLPRANAAAVTADGIRFNKLINNVGFKVNNTDPFVAAKMLGKKGVVLWDKLDTTPTEVDDAEIRGLAFDKRSAVRGKHTEAFQIGVRDYTLRKLAPAAATAGMPIMRTTGPDDGTGRKRMTYADMITWYTQLDLLNLPNKNALNQVLSQKHKQDLILERSETSNYRDGIIIDQSTGELKQFYSMKIWENNANPVYIPNNTLKPEGAAAAGTDRDASVFFYADNAVYYIDSVKLLYTPENIDTTSADPTSKFRTQTYGLCDKVQEHGFGAIVSGIVNP